MKVLLVEDDPKISSFVKIGLESNDCQVDIAFDGTIGEKLALSKKHDVIVLDVVVPGISGFELCRNIREKGIQTPVMMLTSLDTLDDKLTGFDSGADDYLVKPFSFQELYARLKALNRRKVESDLSPVLKCVDLELDTNTRKVFRSEREINLTATEYKILELLLGNKDKVFERVVIAVQTL